MKIYLKILRKVLQNKFPKNKKVSFDKPVQDENLGACIGSALWVRVGERSYTHYSN